MFFQLGKDHVIRNIICLRRSKSKDDASRRQALKEAELNMKKELERLKKEIKKGGQGVEEMEKLSKELAGLENTMRTAEAFKKGVLKTLDDELVLEVSPCSCDRALLCNCHLFTDNPRPCHPTVFYRNNE